MIINTIVALIFGVLLIHANCNAMRTWLWTDTLNNVEMYNSTFGYLHAIISVLTVIMLTVFLDVLRK